MKHQSVVINIVKLRRTPAKKSFFYTVGFANHEGVDYRYPPVVNFVVKFILHLLNDAVLWEMRLPYSLLSQEIYLLVLNL